MAQKADGLHIICPGQSEIILPLSMYGLGCNWLFNGITYMPRGDHLSASDLVPIVGTFGSGRHNVHLYTCGSGSDISAYDLGLQRVYSVKGYSPSFRLAVRTQYGISFFQVVQNPHAKTGSDLFDIRDKVQSIDDQVQPMDKPARTIHDPAEVQELVNKIMIAPVISNCSLGSAISSGSKEDTLSFHLKDGSIVDMNYKPTKHKISTDWSQPQCVDMSQDFTKLLAESK